MKKNKKGFLVLLLLGFVAICIGIYVYKEYNRKAINVADVNANFKLSSKDLIDELTNKPEYFDSVYHSKILEVAGAIKSIDTDEKGFHTIVLGDRISNTTVRCSLDSLQNTKINEYTKLKVVTVKGVYTGFNPDDLGIGSDVILSRCIIVENN